MTDLVLGLDLGTGSVKAVLFDADGLEPVARAGAATTVSTPHADWAESDPGDWERSAEAVSAQVLSEAPRNAPGHRPVRPDARGGALRPGWGADASRRTVGRRSGHRRGALVPHARAGGVGPACQSHRRWNGRADPALARTPRAGHPGGCAVGLAAERLAAVATHRPGGHGAERCFRHAAVGPDPGLLGQHGRLRARCPPGTAAAAVPVRGLGWVDHRPARVTTRGASGLRRCGHGVRGLRRGSHRAGGSPAEHRYRWADRHHPGPAGRRSDPAEPPLPGGVRVRLVRDGRGCRTSDSPSSVPGGCWG